MNVWNRLGDLAEGTKDWIGDVALGAVSLTGAKFAWDMTQSLWNDNEEYNGFAQSLKTAGMETAKAVGRPLGGAIMAVENINRNIIREPLSAAMLYLNNTDKGWEQAWKSRNRISFGQSVIGGYIGAVNSDFDIYDKQDRKAAFENSIYGRVASGLVDTTAQIFGDVSIVGGKAIMAYKAADKIPDAMKAIEYARDGISGTSKKETVLINKYSILADDFAKNDGNWARGHKWVRDSADPATVSYVLGSTKSKEEALNAMLALMGDGKAAKTLSDLSRPDLAVPLKLANGDISKVDSAILESNTWEGQIARREARSAIKELDTFGKEKKFTDDIYQDSLFKVDSDPDELKEVADYLNAWAKHDAIAGRLLNGAKGTDDLALAAAAPLTEGFGRGTRRAAEIATARNVPFQKLTPGSPKIEAYQPTKFHKLYYKASWNQRQRGSGQLNLNELDSIEEIKAGVERLIQVSKPLAGKVKVAGRSISIPTAARPAVAMVRRVLPGEGGFTAEEGATFMEKYAGAQTTEQRQAVLHELETRGYQVLAAKHGLSPEDAVVLANTHIKKRAGYLKDQREQGFMIDSFDPETILDVPQFESQFANIVPMADFDMIDNVLNRSSSSLLAAYGGTLDLLSTTSDLWKAGVLLRIGYPIRNGVDSQLRIWATVGALTSLRHTAGGIRRLTQNTRTKGQRLVDKVDSIGKADYIAIKKDLQTQGATKAKLEKEISQLNKDAAKNPDDIDLANELVFKQQSLEEVTEAYNLNSATMAKREAAQKGTDKKTLGQDDIVLKSSFEGMDGDHIAHGAFGGATGPMYMSFNSVSKTNKNILDSSAKLFDSSYSSKIGTVKPGDDNYYTAWADALNKVFANAKVARRLMDGEDPEKIVQDIWQNDSAYRKGFALKTQQDVREHVYRSKQFVEDYAPEGTGIREAVLSSTTKVKKIPKGIRFEYLNADNSLETKLLLRNEYGINKQQANQALNAHTIIAKDKNNNYIGHISWNKDTGKIQLVNVSEDMQRKGIGTKLFDEASNAKGNIVKPVQEDIVENLSPEGMAWQKAITSGNRVNKVTEKFLREAVTDPEKLPVVHGNLLVEGIENVSGRVSQRAISSVFKFLATLPEDAWARHPLFNRIYQESIQKRFAQAEFMKGQRFTQNEFQEIQYALEKAARNDALRFVKKTLYNVERRSNAAHMLRFISPFFSAQENSVKTWLRIASEKPVIFSRANIIYNAPERMGLVTDENGDPIAPNERPLNGNDSLWLPVPKQLKNLPWIGKGMESLTQVSISKRSLDVVFQGNPFEVSIGPITGIPLAQVLKLKPELGKSLEWAMPYGPNSEVKSVLPTWLRGVVERNSGLNDDSYARAYQLIWLTEQHKARDEGRRYLTEKEVRKLTDNFYNLKLVSSLVLPFSPQFQSPYRYYMDRWSEYSQRYGLEADSRFLDDYPDFFEFATKLSKNPSNVDASYENIALAKKNKGLIDKVYGDNPALVGLITESGPDAKYSATASWWQKQTNVSSGSPDKFRSSISPAEAQRENEARKGWAIYRKGMAIIDENLIKRGLTSINQSGAEDLLEAKNAMIRSLSSEVNPVTNKRTATVSAWYTDYRDMDGTKAARTVEGLKKIISDDDFMADKADDPTWKSIGIYVKVREDMAKMLVGRPSKSIDSEENKDLRMIMDYYINQLKAGDLEFAQIFDRFLSQDSVYDLNVGRY